MVSFISVSALLTFGDLIFSLRDRDARGKVTRIQKEKHNSKLWKKCPSLLLRSMFCPLAWIADSRLLGLSRESVPHAICDELQNSVFHFLY